VSLALPTFGLAFAISVLTTYGPVVLARLTDSSTKIGLLIGGEGAFALALPIAAGALSDRLRSPRLGPRMPFVLAGAPLVAAALLLLPFTPSYRLAAAAIFGFFVGYFLYYPPYRALYADLVPRRFYGRAQGGQALARGLGLGAALLAGGFLLGVWRPLPFLVAAGAVIVTTVALVPAARAGLDSGRRSVPSQTESIRALMVKHGELRAFAGANALWEFSFAGLKSFIVLYVIDGLGRSPVVASAVIAVVAVAYVVAAPVAGRLADRYGILRVLRVAIWIYGCGLVLGVVAHSLPPMLVALPLVAFAGAVLMALPQALAFTLAPEGSEGGAAGLLDFSRGLGVIAGPIAVGGAVDLFRGLFTSTHGYAAMWPVVGIPVLASLFLIGGIDRSERRRHAAGAVRHPR
jgi:MFS family permease